MDASATDTTVLDALIVEKGYFRLGARNTPLFLGVAFINHNFGGGILSSILE